MDLKKENHKGDSLSRKIFINNRKRNGIYKYASNVVTTRKYNIWTFLPKSLYIQFLKVSNFYFLTIAVMQCFPTISPLNPLVSILPLIFVLSASLLREAIEDYVIIIIQCNVM